MSIRILRRRTNTPCQYVDVDVTYINPPCTHVYLRILRKYTIYILLIPIGMLRTNRLVGWDWLSGVRLGCDFFLARFGELASMGPVQLFITPNVVQNLRKVEFTYIWCKLSRCSSSACCCVSASFNFVSFLFLFLERN